MGGEQTTQVSVDLDLTVAVGSIRRHEQAMLCEDIGERSCVPLVPRVANLRRKGMQGLLLDFLRDQHHRLSSPAAHDSECTDCCGKDPSAVNVARELAHGIPLDLDFAGCRSKCRTSSPSVDYPRGNGDGSGARRGWPHLRAEHR